MKEVFKVGYTSYLEKSKKRTKKNRWTSKIGKVIEEHKVIVSFLGVVIVCFWINFWLVYKFISILEMGRGF